MVAQLKRGVIRLVAEGNCHFSPDFDRKLPNQLELLSGHVIEACDEDRSVLPCGGDELDRTIGLIGPVGQPALPDQQVNVSAIGNREPAKPGRRALVDSGFESRGIDQLSPKVVDELKHGLGNSRLRGKATGDRFVAGDNCLLNQLKAQQVTRCLEPVRTCAGDYLVAEVAKVNDAAADQRTASFGKTPFPAENIVDPRHDEDRVALDKPDEGPLDQIRAAGVGGSVDQVQGHRCTLESGQRAGSDRTLW